AGEHAGLLQPAYPLRHRGRRHVHQAAELVVGQPAVPLQLREDPPVGLIQLPAHPLTVAQICLPINKRGRPMRKQRPCRTPHKLPSVYRMLETRRRPSTTALFATAALMNAAMAIASPVSTILAADRAGTAWAALPNPAGILGPGLGALPIP